MKKLIDWGEFYYNFGFKVTNINPLLNDAKKKKIFKAPTNNRHKLKNNIQTLKEVMNLDWINSSGIGTVLGCNNLRALDIDFESKFKLTGETNNINIRPLIKKILINLNLPKDYEWVVITPSGGAHIIFYSPNHKFKLTKNNTSKYRENKTKALKPNLKILKQYPKLGHFELRWKLHLVLPPSQVDNKAIYKFWKKIPTNAPIRISSFDLNRFFVAFCFDNDGEKIGYNLRLNDYHLNHQFLDYTPIIY